MTVILGDVVDIFTNSIDMTDTEANEDLLGRTYEYCIAQFAEKEGASGGEFYTPSSIVKTLVEILKPFENCRVYDPCCGSGGMFVQSAKFIQAHNGKRGAISVYGQEANADTWKMAKMNMAIRGIDANFGPYQADTFTNDWHKTLKADFILANPPFNYHPWNQERLVDDLRWKYGLPPAGNANYAWIQHMIHHLAPNGKIGLVLANGALSTQTSGEGEIRKKIIEDDKIEGIIAMPTQLFYSVTIPVTLWFITDNKKQKGKILFIDARNMGHMVDRKHRDLDDEKDIKLLADTFEAFQNGTLEVFGLNNGMVPIISYNYGAGKRDRVVKIIKLSIGYAVGIMCVGFALMQIIPDKLLLLFDASETMLGIGVPALRIISASFLFAGFCIVCGSVFQALGNGVYSMLVSITRQLVVLLPVAYFLSKLGEVNFVWWAFPIAEIFSLTLSALFLLRIYRKIIRYIGEERAR